MCLGEIARVRSVAADSLEVETRTRTVTVSRMLLDESPRAGDWVLTHSGFALAVLTSEQARDALRIRNESTGWKEQA